jgi:nitroimidazol reductase NimA-like FMN-containing flavoprotein (pyridoxamine 5'-phosphate oxidase superfamily)
MGFRDLTAEEIDLVLEKERIIRIAFAADGEQFVVPVFYTWYEGAFCGLTTPGRKTAMAERNANVGFQVDSTVMTGPWEWASVVGQGTFEQVIDPWEYGAFAAILQARLADAPPWAGKMLQARFEALGVYAWRIRPSVLQGRAHGPE